MYSLHSRSPLLPCPRLFCFSWHKLSTNRPQSFGHPHRKPREVPFGISSPTLYALLFSLGGSISFVLRPRPSLARASELSVFRRRIECRSPPTALEILNIFKHANDPSRIRVETRSHLTASEKSKSAGKTVQAHPPWDSGRDTSLSCH